MMGSNLDRLAQILRPKSQKPLSGKLGYVVRGVYSVIADDPEQYNVRLDDGGFVTAYHRNQIAPNPDERVLLDTVTEDGREKLVVRPVEGERAGESQRTVARHHHMRGSNFEFEIDTWMLTNFRVTALTGLIVIVGEGRYWNNNQFRYQPSASVTLTQPPDAYTQYWGVIALDPATGDLSVTYGDPVAITVPLLLSMLPELAADIYPLAAVKVANGATTLYDSNIADLRTSVGSMGGNATSPLTADLDAGAYDITNLDRLELNEVSAPGTPSSGKVSLYAKTDGKVYSKNDAGTETPLTRTIARQTVFTYEGALAVTTGSIRIPNLLGETFTITKVGLFVSTAPTGAAIIVDVNKNGTTIFTTQANRPQIAIGANSGSTTTINVSSLADGDYLTMDIDQIGSTVAGSYLSVVVVFQ